MRTRFKTTEVPKRLAKAIAHVFPALSLSKAQAWAATLSGYRDWHELDMVTRNYTGEPTPDPFLVEYVEARESYWGAGEEAPDALREAQERMKFQADTLATLMSAPENAFFVGDCHWEILLHAYHGLSGLDRRHLGKGSPLFNDLQYAWFSLEDQARALYDEGEYGTGFDWESIGLFCGFASHRQLDRWLRGVDEKLGKANLAEARDEFPGIVRRVGGGSRIRLARDEQGREVAVQSTVLRFWWRRFRDNRMLGGFTLTARVIARREDSGGDEFEFCLHDTWYDKSITARHRNEGHWPLPVAEAGDMVNRFIRSRTGMDDRYCRIAVAYDRKAGSLALARDFRDALEDSTRDFAGVDVDSFFGPQVVPYRPRYPLPDFFVLKSQLV